MIDKKTVLGYDTINMRLPMVGAERLISELPGAYRKARAADGANSGMNVSHKGIILMANTYGLSVKLSIARYLHGNNLYLLSPNEAGDAICMLSEEIGVDLAGATITRLDFTGNIELNGGYTDFSGEEDHTSIAAPVSEYLRPLGDMPRYQKHVLGNGSTVQYDTPTGGSEYVLYDKSKQMRAEWDERDIPAEAIGKNILRIEMRYAEGRIALRYGAPVTAGLLSDGRLYEWLCNQWLAKFEEIDKQRTLFRLNSTTKNVKELQDEMNAIAIAAIGEENISRLISQQFYGPAKGMGTAFMKRAKKNTYLSTSTLVQEMDEKVHALHDYSLRVCMTCV